MSKILRFPPVPGNLAWIKEWGDDVQQFAREQFPLAKFADNKGKLGEMVKQANRIKSIHSYFRWSAAYHQTEPGTTEHYVAEGLLHKYYWEILGIEGHDMVDNQITEAEAMLKESNEEIRRRKNARSAL